MNKRIILIVLFLSIFTTIFSQTVPKVYSNVFRDDNGKIYVLTKNGKKIYADEVTAEYSWINVFGNPKGTKDGLAFDFGKDFNGYLYYGFIPENDSKHPYPVYLWKKEKIKNGKASININKWMRKQFDIPNWEKFGKSTIGYRVINNHGEFVIDTKINILGKSPFKVAPTIIDGPFVTNITENEATIWFITNKKVIAKIKVGDKFEKEDEKPVTFHEFVIKNLQPETDYSYKIEYGKFYDGASFRTANKTGSDKPFVFAYASDSRNSSGGGERDIYGVNAYILKKLLALATAENSRFLQFTGDLIDGYTSSYDEMKIQYYNWKYTVEPFAKYFPIYVTMGNHENYVYFFRDEEKGTKYVIDKFPFDKESSEVFFENEFELPHNTELITEDGAEYDPDPNSIDFPPYDETVYSYVYGNVAVIVLNSDYFYSPSVRKGFTLTSGGLHGYIMDKQLEWLKKTLDKYEKDSRIKHVFVTQHTPVLPNGGHLQNAMWYSGENKFRPYVAGKPLKYGVLEQRDRYLDLVVNHTTKVRAILTGDEHNYSRTEIGPKTDIYPKNWSKPKLKIKRTIYQINNGAAGAPYYSQEKTPWTNKVEKFTTQNALVLFYVNGNKIHVKVKNPDTLELIEEFDLQ